VKVLKHYSVVFPAGCFKRAVLENVILIFGNPVHLLHIRKSELSCPNVIFEMHTLSMGSNQESNK